MSSTTREDTRRFRATRCRRCCDATSSSVAGGPEKASKNNGWSIRCSSHLGFLSPTRAAFTNANDGGDGDDATDRRRYSARTMARQHRRTGKARRNTHHTDGGGDDDASGGDVDANTDDDICGRGGRGGGDTFDVSPPRLWSRLPLELKAA